MQIKTLLNRAQVQWLDYLKRNMICKYKPKVTAQVNKCELSPYPANM